MSVLHSFWHKGAARLSSEHLFFKKPRAVLAWVAFELECVQHVEKEQHLLSFHIIPRQNNFKSYFSGLKGLLQMTVLMHKRYNLILPSLFQQKYVPKWGENSSLWFHQSLFLVSY